MKKHDWKAWALGLMALVCIAGLSCSQYVDQITPVVVTPEVEYYTGVKIPQWCGFTTLSLFKQEDRRADLIHRDTQIELKRMVQDDKITYADVKAVTTPTIEQAEILQATLVGGAGDAAGMLPGGGLLTLGLGLFGGGALGRKIKRPGDLSPAEVDEKVAKEKLNG